MSQIHATAIVSPKAKLGEGVTIGPYCIVEDNVCLGDNVSLKSHVIVTGHTTIGRNTKVFPFAVIGEVPQHNGYKGEPTTVEIGSDVTIRESVTIHRGTTFGMGKTLVGDRSLVMAYCHVAHDCVVGREVIMANNVQMAGHTEIQDFSIVGGSSALAQFTRVGRYCYVGGSSSIRKDLPPFLTGKGHEFEVQGINNIGLVRRGFSEETVRRLRDLFRIFYKQHLTVVQATDKILTELGETDEVKAFLDFVKTSKTGFVR